ncbi:rod shape-determining protein [Helicobacter sp. 23-1048]
MFDKFVGALSKDIAIDLGTANTVVIVKGEGIVINEPSVVAVQTDKRGTDRILAVGYEAKEVAGKTPDRIKAVRPMKDGVIADFEMTEKMIRFFIEKAHKRKSLVRPRVMVCVPYGLTGVEKKAVRESALGAGAREVYLIEEPMAAAIGAGLQTDEAKGNLVIDIGGGTTEIGVVSYSGLVVSKSIKVAGDKFDMAIQDYVRKKYNLLIGERTAEEIKLEIGSASPLENPLTYQVNGRDNVSGLLNTIPLTSEDCREAMKEQLKEIANALKSVLEETPPDLSGDIVENGIVLTGGGALIRGLDKYLSDIVKLPVYVAEEPLLCVAKGTGRAMEDPRLLEELAIE